MIWWAAHRHNTSWLTTTLNWLSDAYLISPGFSTSRGKSKSENLKVRRSICILSLVVSRRSPHCFLCTGMEVLEPNSLKYYLNSPKNSECTWSTWSASVQAVAPKTMITESWLLKKRLITSPTTSRNGGSRWTWLTFSWPATHSADTFLDYTPPNILSTLKSSCYCLQSALDSWTSSTREKKPSNNSARELEGLNSWSKLFPFSLELSFPFLI